MAQPVIDSLSRQRVIVVGIAANCKLADHYGSFGAVHDTPHRGTRLAPPDAIRLPRPRSTLLRPPGPGRPHERG